MRKFLLFFIATWVAGSLFCAQAAKLNCTSLVTELEAKLPEGTYTVAHDLPVGTVIAPFTGFFPSSTAHFKCSRSGPGTTTLAGLIHSTTQVVYIDKDAYVVARTDVDGIGLIAKFKFYRNNALVSTQPMAPIDLPKVDWANESSFSNHTFGVQVSVALVKTGPSESGTVTIPPIVRMQVYVTDYSDPIGGAQTEITFPDFPIVIAPTCMVEASDVSLAPAEQSALRVMGDSTGKTSFVVNLIHCSIGIDNLRYRLTPAPDVASIDDQLGIFGLGSTSMAGGIGLQILDDTDKPLPLGNWHMVPGYNKLTGGAYAIPLHAGYIRTSAPLTPGNVESQLIFTLSYQ